MIRITSDRSHASHLTVEGTLSGRAVDELRQSCAGLCAADTVLNLSGVMFADRAAAAALRELAAAGFVLQGCSAFLDELMRDGGAAQPPSEEVQLIERLRAGDEEAFELMVRRYGGRMLSTAQRILRSESDARDAVQEAFLSVFRSIGHFAGEAALGTWLHRIVVNAALMQMRSRRRRGEESIEDLLPRFDENGGWADGPMPVPAVDDLQESRERMALVRRCVDRLPERYRTVLILRDIEDLDTEHTARMLGATPTAVKVRLHRARQALKTLIEREAQSSRPYVN
jgi:RNA polymerase sigma-70 factor (ECF subfamily)